MISVSSTMPQMQITGERTVPGVWHENYWFRRHEVVYERLADLVRGRRVLEAGCGDGYGANLLSKTSGQLIALDYDDYAAGHVRMAYPRLPVVRANLVALPFDDESFDVVVSLQTIEHLWDQNAFVAECMRVLRGDGTLVVSTPNTLTFPPGNIYHPHELDAAQLHDVVANHGVVTEMTGLQHGPRLSTWEATHGSVVDAQINSEHHLWSEATRHMVDGVATSDFCFSTDHIDASLDLIITAAQS